MEVLGLPCFIRCMLQAGVERLWGGWKVGPVDQLEASLYRWSVGEMDDLLKIKSCPQECHIPHG